MECINQTEKMTGLSDRYGKVNTRQVLDVFERQGWTIADVAKSTARKAEKKGFESHLIRLEHPNFESIPGLTDDNRSRVQLCLVNSHDGTKAFRLFLGLIRFACLNGMISGTIVDDFRAIHSKHVLDKLKHGIDQITRSIPSFVAHVQKLQALQFTAEMQRELADIATTLRLSNVGKLLAFNPLSALKVRREADRIDDGFTVLNRVQEAIMRGGIQYSYARQDKATGLETVGHSTTRAITSINKKVQLNRALFDAALKIAA